ncbi:hypothetical protein D3C72_1989570 [compost metagenome]
MPMKASFSRKATAHKPQPRSAIRPLQRLAMASLASRDRVAGKQAITRGSPFSAANGAKSLSRHCRSTRRGVTSSMISCILTSLHYQFLQLLDRR